MNIRTDNVERIKTAAVSQSFNAHEFSLDDLTAIVEEIFLQVIYARFDLKSNFSIIAVCALETDYLFPIPGADGTR